MNNRNILTDENAAKKALSSRSAKRVLGKVV